MGWARRRRRVARWLGELRAHFPAGVVRVVQQDAIDRLGLHRLLLEPEVLDSVTPDVHLAATLMSLRDALPEASRQVARRLVRQVVEDIERRLADRTRSAARGALDRSARTVAPAARRDRLGPHDPGQPAPLPARAPDGHPGAARRPRAPAALARGRADPRARPERQHGRLGRPRRRARRRRSPRCPTLQTRVIAFDTSVVDLTDELERPGRRAVRHPARRRHRHRPGARLLPDARRPARRRPCSSSSPTSTRAATRSRCCAAPRA